MSNTDSDKIAAQLGWRINMKVTGDLRSSTTPTFVALNSPTATRPAQDGSVR
ncbi:Uncharacterised protein [Mycobacteroides abscessus subsp. massiliense]|uniref:hypothetical protein n=1 Tax=Mycobacteroides abscessus TaxID=36809 RepID=UPI000926AE31|nr:hypothetical protein [Mycobacteroides abscessus]SHV74250.1 Uncharacterised protein [Mycobacteroides abscessus subsp. abscessus]SHW33057.1 Uncharacterised protein [Mycobacteroides abscessus subsp. abscessus]SHW39246.1 Uncharacterised protein [Mycobacteroides abscessus subsp. abscessus]SHW67660.1 Uncharacterised protein [Mycobacteroides abscessus subsp. abscessus]SHX16680.1 Uncharacterised protein [Mycobacteroides abscessus subsp. abscessus]